MGIKKNNKTCICCSKKYTYCNSCEEYWKYPNWMAIYHNENCKKIFDICTDYNANILTKEQAKEKLDQCDLSYKANLKPSLIKTINEIFGNIDVEKADEKKEKKVIHSAKIKVKSEEMHIEQ